MAYLSRLRLTNFRNLTGLDLELSPGVSVYFGPNAQGKTTLLEARVPPVHRQVVPGRKRTRAG